VVVQLLHSEGIGKGSVLRFCRDDANLYDAITHVQELLMGYVYISYSELGQCPFTQRDVALVDF